jgi:hypothetical protein
MCCASMGRPAIAAARSFDQIYAVFDRDDHDSYIEALDHAKSLDRKLLNDGRDRVVFKAIASVPSFELWLLLYYANIQIPATARRYYSA